MGLMKMDSGGEIRHDLQEILKAASRSADLTRQLLAFARKQTISPRVLDLNDSVSGMLKMLQRLIGENIHLVWMPGPGLWKVRIDPSRLTRFWPTLLSTPVTRSQAQARLPLKRKTLSPMRPIVPGIRGLSRESMYY